MVTKTLTIISEKNYVFATLYKKYRVFQPPYLAGINSFFLKPISSNPPKSGSKIVPTGRPKKGVAVVQLLFHLYTAAIEAS